MNRICFLVALLLLAAGSATAESFRLPRSTPEAQGVSSAALLAFLDAAEEKVNSLHSFMLVRRGQVVAEGWWAPYTASDPHQMFSLSKSFTSTAVGFAVTEGRLGIDDPVLEFFPDEAPPQPSANLRAMRVRDLLTMATGHHNEDIQNFPYNSEESVVRKFLALPVTHKPGTFFVYNTPASYMLSAIVQKVTGQPVLEYLKPRLFDPLGIEHPTWDASRQGVSMGGFGLNVRTEDIARFGQFYLQRGQWGGKQLLPAAWIDSATSRWMSNGSAPTSDWEQGYGFQFWRCRHGVYRGDGAHGQFCVVFPQQDAVIAITAGTRDLQGVLNLVWEKLLPALGDKPLPANAQGVAQLTDRLAKLSLPKPVVAAMSTGLSAITGRAFAFPQNPQRIERVTLRSATELAIVVNGAEQRLTVAPDAWSRSEFTLGGTSSPVATRGAWVSPDTFALDLVRYQTPFALRMRLRFAGNQVTLESEPNLGPANARPPALVGRME